MPVYTLPNFNLLCDIWQALLPPPGNPATWVNVPCQLFYNSRGAISASGGALQLRMPWDPTKVVTGPAPWVPLSGDIVNVPAGSASWYEVRWCDPVHRGFPNQYTAATIVQVDPLALPAIQLYSYSPA